MNDNLEHIARDLKDISLTPAERLTLRQTLVAAMQVTRPTAGAWAFLARHALALSAVGVIAVAGTGLAAAHNSLPGDFFYPVRLAVNDRIAVAMAGDEDARLDVEFQQVTRAIDDEELVADHELAGLVVADGDTQITTQQPDRADERSNEHVDEDVHLQNSEDVHIDADLDGELRDLQHQLDDEEAAANLELSL